MLLFSMDGSSAELPSGGGGGGEDELVDVPRNRAEFMSSVLLGVDAIPGFCSPPPPRCGLCLVDIDFKLWETMMMMMMTRWDVEDEIK